MKKFKKYFWSLLKIDEMRGVGKAAKEAYFRYDDRDAGAPQRSSSRFSANSRGFSMVEVLVAFAVLTLVMTATMGVVFGSQTLSLDGQFNNHALYRSARAIEDSFAVARGNFDSLISQATVTDSEGYEKTITVTDITPCVKRVAADVQWTAELGRTQSVNLTTVLTSTSSAFAMGGDCETSPPPGGWDASSSYPMSDPIFSGSLATDVDALKRPDGRFALVTTLKNPSPSGSNTLWMVDVTDLDADPMPFSAYGTDDDLWAVDALDDYAFAVGATTSAQKPLQIFDISDETAISLAAEAPLNKANTGIGRSVYYNSDKVYVGTQYLPCVACAADVNHEFHIFDVTDRAAPVWQASINVQRNVNGIVVRNGLAYLATGPGGDNTVLKIYDVDPTSGSYLSLVGSYAASSAEEGTVLYLLGNYIYLGRERTTGANHDFLVVDVSNPALPTLADSDILNLNNDKEVSGMHVSGGFAFIVTTDTTPSNGGGPFILYDVSDPTNISPIAPCLPVNWSEKPTGLDMVDDYAFVSNESNDALQVIFPSSSCTP